MKRKSAVESQASQSSDGSLQPVPVSRSPIWLFETISRKHRSHDMKKRCQVRIPDTVLFDPVTGTPVTWLLNSSSGHIIRKKGIAIQAEEPQGVGLLESPGVSVSKRNSTLPGVTPQSSLVSGEGESEKPVHQEKVCMDLAKLRNKIIKTALERQEESLGNPRENFKEFAKDQEVDEDELELDALNLGNSSRSFKVKKRKQRQEKSKFRNVIVATVRRLVKDPKGLAKSAFSQENLHIWDFLDIINAAAAPTTSNAKLNGLAVLQGIVVNSNPLMPGKPADVEHLSSTYLNHYTGPVQNRDGSTTKLATATFKFLSPKTGLSSGKMIRSKAIAINQQLDNVTQQIVRYTESVRKVRVACLSCEYIIDKQGEPWLMWCSDVQIIPGPATSLQDNSSTTLTANTSSEWSQSHASTFLSSDSSTLNRSSETTLEASMNSVTVTTANQNGSTSLNSRQGKRGKSSNKNQTLSSDVERMAMGVQVGSAVNSLSTFEQNCPAISGAGLSGRAPPVTHGALGCRKPTSKLQSNFRIGIRPDSEVVDDPVQRRKTKCAGDFCDFRVEDPEGFSEVKTIPAVEAARQLFSKEELAALAEKVNLDVYGTKESGEDEQSSRNGGSSGNHSQHYLNYKSIVLARKEKRTIVDHLSQQQIYDIDGNMDTLIAEQAARNSELPPESLMESNMNIYNNVGLGNYYKQVQVCSNCFKMYTTLDRAREVLESEKRSRSAGTSRSGSRGKVKSRGSGSEWIGDKSKDRDRPPSANTLARIQRRREMRAERQQKEEEEERHSSKGRKVVKTPPIANPQVAKAQRQVKAKVKELQDAVGGRTVLPKMDRHAARELKKRKGIQTLGDLEGYLRGNGVPGKEEGDNMQAIQQSNQERKEDVSPAADSNSKDPVEASSSNYCGKVLVVEPDPEVAKFVHEILAEGYYECTLVQTGEEALERSKSSYFDLMLLTRDLDGINGIEVCKLYRKYEKRLPRDHRRLPIVAFTESAEPADLRLYMEVGMDGCVSKPVDETSLLNTMAAAIPHHKPDTEHALLKKRNQLEKNEGILKSAGGGFGIRGADSTLKKLRPQTTGLVNASNIAKLTLPVSLSAINDESTHGVFQLDADTSLPYCVLGKRRLDSPMFNFVVLHDFFDTYETMEIFFKPLVAKYPGLQVLLFNTPGQAHTEWRRDAVLNNEYLADCVEAVLRYVDYNGTGEFHTRGPYGSPFYLVGFGNGANVATCHSVVHKHSNLRAAVLLNGFSHVDAHLAGVLHDCMNVFSCSPSTRPDLPIYFYSRFIFSSAYLTRVSTPLALNLYTAVHNPITLQGRMQICKGALAHLDLRPLLKEDHAQPLVMVQSAQGGLVKPHHVDPFVQARGGAVESVRRALKDRAKPCVVWMKAGHELFQECRKPLLHLIEQLATGYHEKHDVVFLPHQGEPEATASMGPKRTLAGRGVGLKAGEPHDYFEDRFINNVLGSVRESSKKGRTEPHLDGPLAPGEPGTVSGTLSEFLPTDSAVTKSTYKSQTSWDEFQSRIREKTKDSVPVGIKKPKTQKRNPRAKVAKEAFSSLTLNEEPVTDLNPYSKSFNRQIPKSLAEASSKAALQVPKSPVRQKEVLGDETNPNVSMTSDVPEVREYMRWRIARNRKRLAKLEEASRVMQRSWRAFVARTLMMRLKTAKAALLIQRQWRAKKGRDALGDRRKQDWAARLLQRQFRGRHGRLQYRERQEQKNAAQNLQRLFRGRLGKKRVDSIKNARIRSAKMIQKIFRGYKARGTTWRKRRERNAATEIQRLFRGWVGRSRAILEREKFLFSKAQSQGIDFGRQMLLEHKLHGTRLQSEVSLLTKEKVETEEKVEALLGEIAEFDDGVIALEREMHELSKVETEAKGILDEEAKMELREQKMRLDREFGVMLGKIGDRKERLRALEVKLQTIDRSRQGKEEELRDLERKLVVLLEEQQQELEQIKQRQEKRGELVLSDNIVAVGSGTTGEGVTLNANGKVVEGENLVDQGAASSKAYKGPTPLQQEQANALMQSTESLMKFGFMSMSLTYFSSLNMVRAMRKIGAVNTIMNGSGGSLEKLLENVQNSTGDSYKPQLRKGEMPGQEKVTLAVWSVQDVGDWLDSLSLGHYKGCFEDAAIDGAFLCDLNDDDLRNTLGIEHNLHRKKLLNSIQRLRYAEQMRTQSKTGGIASMPIAPMGIAAAQMTPPGALEMAAPVAMPSMNIIPEPVHTSKSTVAAPTGIGASGQPLRLDKLITIVRHGKTKDLKAVLGSLPDRPFDVKDIAQAYVEGFGTQYTEEVNREAWHINKPDEYGNSLLTIACQNGHQKIAQYLVQKSANPNHQNNQGQTPLHYAMTYNFFDLGAWLTDTEKGASADDSITNMYGLTPYDGLSPD